MRLLFILINSMCDGAQSCPLGWVMGGHCKNLKGKLDFKNILCWKYADSESRDDPL